MPSFLRLLVPLCLASLVGCSYVSEKTEQANGPEGRAYLDLASQPTFYSQSKIYRADVQVTVHPNVNLPCAPSALFVPLGLTQDMRDQLRVSQGVSRQVWQQLVGSGAFSTLELADMRPPYRVDQALPVARRLGAEFLVGGYITYYFDGASNTDSKLSLQLEVYDVKSGDLIWAMGHAGVLPYEVTRDFLLWQSKTRMPADPMGTLIAAVAGDMGELLHLWADPEYAASLEKKDRASRPFDTAFGKF